ncbi:MAG: hypothetical protein GY930_02690 [bacterium]|nr:hypothetical protein [bacterium]
MSPFYNLLWSALFITGAWFAFLSGFDRDTPTRKPAIVSIGVLLLGLGLPWQQIVQFGSWISMFEIQSNSVATDGEGSFFIATSRAFDSEGQPTYYLMTPQPRGGPHAYKHFVVDPETHELEKEIELPRRVHFKRMKEFPTYQNFFSMATYAERADEARGSQAAPLTLLRVHAGHPKGSTTHFIQTEAKVSRKWVLDRNGEPFSDDVYVHLGEDGAVWIGDAEDQTIWVADLTGDSPKYEQVPLPDGYVFTRWASPSTALEDRLRASIPGEGPLVYLPSKGKHAALNLESHSVVALSEDQEQWIQDEHAKSLGPQFGMGSTGLVVPKQLNFFGERREVHDENGEVLFAHDFTAKTSRERFWVAMRLGVSALTVPVLQPGSFGMTRGGYMPPPFYRNSALSYEKYVSRGDPPGLLRAWIGPALDWRSIPFWLLLAGLAWAMRRRLQKLGASGPRLWIWPLAIMCFGVLGALVCWITERRRAYLPAAAEMEAGVPEPLLKSA